MYVKPIALRICRYLLKKKGSITCIFFHSIPFHENMSDEQPSADHSRATGAFPVANATAPGGSQHRIREDLPDDEGYDPRLSITMLSMGGTK